MINEILEISDDECGGMPPLVGADDPPPLAESSSDDDERARRNARIQYGQDIINRYQYDVHGLQSDSDDSDRGDNAWLRNIETDHDLLRELRRRRANIVQCNRIQFGHTARSTYN